MNEYRGQHVVLSDDPGHDGDYKEAMRMRLKSLESPVELV